MLEVILQNSIWLLFFVSVSTSILLTFVFFTEIKIILSNKKLLLLLLIFPAIGLFSNTFSVTWILENKLNLLVFLFAFSLITATIFGLLTKLVLQIVRGEKTNFLKATSSIRNWFIPSILAFCLGFGGNQLIFYFLSDSEFHSKIFLTFIWTAVTFALYPLLITDKGNIFYALPRALKITFQTIHKWFYLFLTVVFVSGEFLQLFPSSSVRVSWTGGYSFQPVWFDLMIKSANLSPMTTICIYIAVLFICSVIATLVKIRLTKILFDLGYISDNLNNSSVK